MAERSKHQNKVIRDFYKNRGAISLQKLGELVSELYLADGKAREKVWDRIVTALGHLELKPERIAHLREQDNPELLARLVEELMGGK